MRIIQVSEGQTPVDIALQQYGNLESVFDLADLSGISITDLLNIGATMQAGNPIDEAITALFVEQWQKPVSSFEEDELLSAEGLDYWVIEEDFEVN